MRSKNGFKVLMGVGVLIVGCVVLYQTQGLATSSDGESTILHHMVRNDAEIKALEKVHRHQLKTLKEAQEEKRADFEKAEKEARYRFFAEHPKGAERREYIKAFIQRRMDLKKQLADEKAQFLAEHAAKVQQLKTGQ